MEKSISYEQYSAELLKQIKQGAFLTVLDGEKSNVMTIGWGSIGFIWGRPVFSVLVRYSRYTYELLEKASEFSVSVPINNDMKKELAYCGSHSGRDVDKYRECGLVPEAGKILRTPVIEGCTLFFECKIICRQAMQPALVDDKVIHDFYGNNDYHVLYHGEIATSYVRE